MARKFLLIQTASIGDVILTTPVLEKLNDLEPGSSIDILVKQGMDKLFRDHPFVRKIWVWEKRINKSKNLIYLLNAIRRERYDLLVNVQRFASTGFLTAFSGAGQTAGFVKNPFSFLFTHRLKHEIGDGLHEVQRNLSLVGHLGGSRDYPVRLYPSEADRQEAGKYIEGEFITVAPASLWQTKQYPEEKWAEFLAGADKNLKIYLLGSKNDDEICRRIMHLSEHPGAMTIAGRLDFLQTAALMKEAKMNFVNDSAPQHLASAVNAPVTTVFCSTVPSFGFGPLSDDSAVVESRVELDCRPCGLHGFRKCPKGHFKCALTIKVEQLLERL